MMRSAIMHPAGRVGAEAAILVAGNSLRSDQQLRFTVQQRFPSKRHGVGGRPRRPVTSHGPEVTLRELERQCRRWLGFHQGACHGAAGVRGDSRPGCEEPQPAGPHRADRAPGEGPVPARGHHHAGPDGPRRLPLRGPGAGRKTARLAVTEERDLTSTALLTDSPDEQIRIFLQSPVVSAKLKEGLKKAQGLRREWGKTQREAGERRRQLQAVAEGQGRLRADLREVPQPSPLHRRYLGQLGRQAGEVEKYRAEAHSIFILSGARWCPRRDLPPWPGGRSANPCHGATPHA
jgi:hypothetical protein